MVVTNSFLFGDFKHLKPRIPLTTPNIARIRKMTQVEIEKLSQRAIAASGETLLDISPLLMPSLITSTKNGRERIKNVTPHKRNIPAKTSDTIAPTLRNIRDVLFMKLPHLNYNVFAAYKNLHNEKFSFLMLFTLSTY